MLDRVKSSEERLADIKAFLAARLRQDEQSMRENGTSYTNVFEVGLQLNGLVRGSEVEVNQKLLKWYESHDEGGNGELFQLIEAYLLSAGLIPAEKQKPVYEIAEGTSVEEMVAIFRAWLADPSKGSPEDREFWQGVVDTPE